ncbi:MAG: primosomal protein N' [Parvibaculales bacterium]
MRLQNFVVATRLAFHLSMRESADMQSVSVLIPLALPGPYDYAVPEGLGLVRGDFVRVPLGSRQVNGVVWGPGAGDIAPAKMKSVLARLDAPALADPLMQFVDWVAAYVLAPPGLVLRQVMRVPAAFEPEKPVFGYQATGVLPDRMTPARQRVLDVMQDTPPLPGTELARLAGVSASVVKGLFEAGALQKTALQPSLTRPRPDPNFARLQLTPDQGCVATALADAVAQQDFGVHVLDGVTGSGKTEVYFEAIARALEAGRPALILLPEISLTAQFLARFERRFGCAPALWHSGLTPAERRRTWRAVAENRVQVLVGARSALFLPWPDLGVIIVDEEHDGGFKQEDGVVYNARDMAIVRAQLTGCSVILSSATPSLETFVNARQGRYQTHRLAARHGMGELPDIELVDMRATPPARGTWLVPQILTAMEAAMARGEQALLFLNRRGYAPLTICRACGHRYDCPNCDAWMVEHRFRRQLECHHCGHTRPTPEACDNCGAADELVACGPGVERITEEVTARFPEARTAILSSDHAGGVAGIRQTIKLIAEGGVDIIVGTQIVAKGHHFPQLSFVGVVDADLGLGNGDLRAAERTYQMLSQVAGRAGRETTGGRALLQTHMPEHPVLQALVSGDRDAFLEREAEARELAAMPPFGRLGAIIISATDQQEGLAFVTDLARKTPTHEHVRVLGPAPAPIARIRDRYRFRFLLKAGRQAPLQAFINQWLSAAPRRGSIRISVDIDPYSFL